MGDELAGSVVGRETGGVTEAAPGAGACDQKGGMSWIAKIKWDERAAPGMKKTAGHFWPAEYDGGVCAHLAAVGVSSEAKE